MLGITETYFVLISLNRVFVQYVKEYSKKHLSKIIAYKLHWIYIGLVLMVANYYLANSPSAITMSSNFLIKVILMCSP